MGCCRGRGPDTDLDGEFRPTPALSYPFTGDIIRACDPSGGDCDRTSHEERQSISAPRGGGWTYGSSGP